MQEVKNFNGERTNSSIAQLFPYPLPQNKSVNLHPNKKIKAMHFYTLGFVVSLIWNFILNGINFENWKSALGILASLFFLVLLAVEKIKTMKHKSRMRKFQYDREEIRNQRLKNLNIEDEEKELGI